MSAAGDDPDLMWATTAAAGIAEELVTPQEYLSATDAMVPIG